MFYDWLIDWLIDSFIHSFIHSFIDSLIDSLIEFIDWIHWFIDWIQKLQPTMSMKFTFNKVDTHIHNAYLILPYALRHQAEVFGNVCIVKGQSNWSEWSVLPSLLVRVGKWNIGQHIVLFMWIWLCTSIFAHRIEVRWHSWRFQYHETPRNITQGSFAINTEMHNLLESQPFKLFNRVVATLYEEGGEDWKRMTKVDERWRRLSRQTFYPIIYSSNTLTLKWAARSPLPLWLLRQCWEQV